MKCNPVEQTDGDTSPTCQRGQREHRTFGPRWLVGELRSLGFQPRRGAVNPAQGNALGLVDESEFQALKGRHFSHEQHRPPFQGLAWDKNHNPGRRSRWSLALGWINVAPLGLRTNTGSTLSEVLISLLVMSIGVVSLATLFPVSVLRSIQATQLTNAANLRYNVEALTAVRPELLNGGTAWTSGTAYVTSPRSFVVPSDRIRQFYPRLMFACTTAGTSGTNEPSWDPRPGNTTADGGAVWTAFTVDNYIVDPLGFHEVDPNDALGLRGFFGNTDDTTAGIFGGISASGTPRAVTRVRRFTPLWADDTTEAAAAADAATLPDSWVDQAESNDLTVTATSSTLNDVTIDLSSLASVLPAPRAVFFDATGKTSAVRTLTGLSGVPPTITWAAASGALPPSVNEDADFDGVLDAGEDFNGNGILDRPAKCRVETQERRYTWLLSVRRGASGASFMDVVVFFRRSYNQTEETIYPAFFTETTDPGFDGQPGHSGVDDDRNGTTDDNTELNFPGSDDMPRNWVVVEYKSTLEKPLIKKGGYVCDIQNLRWYRILDFIDSPSNATVAIPPSAVFPTGNDDLWKPINNVPSSTNSTGYDRSVWVKIENHVLEDSLSFTSANNNNPLYGGAMFVKGVIDVYPIRTRLPWGD